MDKGRTKDKNRSEESKYKWMINISKDTLVLMRIQIELIKTYNFITI